MNYGIFILSETIPSTSYFVIATHKERNFLYHRMVHNIPSSAADIEWYDVA